MEKETEKNLPNKKEDVKDSEPVMAKGKSKVFMIVLVALVLAGGWFGVSKYRHSLHHEETDDAQIEADIIPVIPRVSGYVSQVRVQDNQQVHKGDTLVVIDDRELRIHLMEAEAALATAHSSVSASKANYHAAHAGIASSEAGVSTIDAQIEAAKIKINRATQDYNRYTNLIKDHSITQQQFEEAEAAKESAEKQVLILQEQKKQARSNTGVVSSQSNATSQSIEVAESIVKQREVDVANAKLNLSYAIITAPEDGKVSKVQLQEGQLLQMGQSTFSIVRNKGIWVVANFKETQYRKMIIGQKVTVHADAFPDHDFPALLSSFSPATGAKFSLLPADNATGNFVKVVQRLPVKIEFTNPTDTLLKRLRPGMNVNVDVNLD